MSFTKRSFKSLQKAQLLKISSCRFKFRGNLHKFNCKVCMKFSNFGYERCGLTLIAILNESNLDRSPFFFREILDIRDRQTDLFVMVKSRQNSHSFTVI